jgi:hypothetical protein
MKACASFFQVPANRFNSIGAIFNAKMPLLIQKIRFARISQASLATSDA